MEKALVMDNVFVIDSGMVKSRNFGTTLFLSIIAAFVILTSIFFFREARNFVGRSFPGFLTFENGMVGAFGAFDWSGYEAGIRYHDIIVSEGGENRYDVQQNGEKRPLTISSDIFSLKDFLIVFFAPFASGMFYLILAIVIFLVGRHMKGIVPFVCFNLCISYYLIASFDFHSGHHASWLFLLSFLLIPATMSHFALIFPERWGPVKRHASLVFIPYILSIAVAIPYIATFYRHPVGWETWERVVVAYVVLSYFFWIGMLARNARFAAQGTDRIAAVYLLLGQLVAFLIPLTSAVAIFIFRRNVPLNIITPVTVVLPIASLFGIVLGNLRNTQIQLVQTEKMASLGRLVAGVAHEINNPTTFIYSNIAMLREYVGYLKGIVKTDAAKFKGEMTPSEVVDDLGKLVGTVSEGATRIRDIVSDLRRFGHSQDDIVTQVNIRAGIEGTLSLIRHEIGENVRVHVDVDKGFSIEANSGQINQLWMNLLTNALQAIGDSGEVWISGGREGNVTFVTIRDNGRGIPREILGRIFDPFFTTKPEGKGTGLGLAICQQIVHKWGGQISVISEEGKGTTVKVQFKLSPSL